MSRTYQHASSKQVLSLRERNDPTLANFTYNFDNPRFAPTPPGFIIEGEMLRCGIVRVFHRRRKAHNSVFLNIAGGQRSQFVNRTGKVAGNLAQLNNSTNTLPLFAWWNASTNHKLYIIDNSSYLYGSLLRQ